MKAVIFVKQSQRLPGKHLMTICGEPMLSRIYRTLEHTGLFETVVVYSKYPDLALDGCLIERDPTTGTLIDSILDSIVKFGEFLAVGGDLPLLNSEVVSEFVLEYDGRPLAAVNSEGTIEPLFAIYNRRIYGELLESSKHSKQIFTFVKERFHLIQINEERSRSLFNVNTLEDLEKARNIADCSHTASR
ncbi:MAG: NTP transferase domain-containing protein [Candidatus Thermoplasmatota archaeon]|nr:NTP transferase domain-containing protein [Candidatus Thermoplasmatota archaeon]